MTEETGQALRFNSAGDKQYEPSEEMLQRLENNFTYHSPLPSQKERYEQLRNTAKFFARSIYSLTPPSREQSLALTKLEEAVMWANAAIARNEPAPAPAQSAGG